jgi:hypothetical protein
MITANVIYRVFRIKYGNSTGTAFAIDIDARQYLVTARHVLEGFGDEDTVEIFCNNQWKTHLAKLVGNAEGDIDISVLTIARELPPSRPLPLPAESKGLGYGQDVFFLGFPYGLLSKYTLHPSEGAYPLPLVKKAIVSNFDADVFLLDGHNNPGFSGGPVVFKPIGSNEFKVAGVISGFQSVEQPVFDGKSETPFVYQYNTGIIVSYDICHAVDLIKGNPIGVRIATNST